ncbi:MAG: 30S ribosomal protein S12 methylthiotransferase RimO [Bacteroidales bacterium]|nr:30S ribosomal protein S12 methylthiotransferase RimO [Bacteroidales bacterium]
MKSLQVITLGCSKNTVDTERLLARLDGVYDILPENWSGPADILLVNTCGFIGDAKEESIQTVLASAARKKAGEVGRLLVFGCLSQRYMGQLPGLIPEVDGWFGARDQDPLIRSLGGRVGGDTGRRRTDSHAYAYLKISEGCDRRCAYCAIPLIRGPHKSVPIEELVKETELLAGAGVKELILIAQDTTFYGLDLYRERKLAELIRRLSEVEGIEWIRIHYSYPADFPEDVLDEMASNPKVCKYLDIPLQHISDKVLSKMRRQVDGAWTRKLVRELRDRIPGVALRTTMIVGHPGEGKRDFAELLDFVREARFERLGAFMYSEEEGTFGAANYRDRISRKEKNERLSELMSVKRDISLAFNQSRVATMERVLVDDYSDGVLVCRSSLESPDVDGEIVVRYDAGLFWGKTPEELRGRFIDVKITGADEYDLIAEPVK